MTGILALGLAVPAAAQQAEVTLQEAITRALLVQPAMVQARGDQRNAGAALRASAGAFLPTVSSSGSASRAGGTRFNAQTNQIVTAPASTTFSGGLSASLEVFDGFRRFADRSASAATDDAAEAGVVNQRFQVTLATKQAFYNALANEELVRVAQSQVRRAQQQLQISVEKLRAGSATRSDSLRSTVDYGTARIALLQAQANLATAQANLGRQIGVDQPVRAVPDSALPALPDTAALRASALERAPQVDQADAQARAAGAQVGVSRAAYFPTFSASVSNSFSGSEAPWSSTSSYLSGWRVSLSGSWTLFNGLSRERQLTTAIVARDVARARAADTRRQVSAQLTQQLAAMATTYEKITIGQANVAAATEDLRVQNERYRVGAATILDLLTSQTALTTAEKDLVQARFDYLIARAQVEALVGRAL
ncbi:MAG TPA: TolC family protein [Gemmatimonadales bacterium]|nr:TolC family protein [Gemmatimonadales bacterium]